MNDKNALYRVVTTTWVTVGLWLALASGCAAPAPRLETEGIETGEKPHAVLHRTEHVGIASVDGKARLFTPTHLKISPGRHQVTVRIAPTHGKKWPLTFTAEKNHTYDIAARPCSVGGRFLDGTLLGFTSHMWEVVVLDSDTNTVVATDGGRDAVLRRTMSFDYPILSKDENIEIRIDKIGFADSITSILNGKTVSAPKEKSLLLVRFKIILHNDILVSDFGYRGVDLSHLVDDNDNEYPLQYWHTISGFTLHEGPFWTQTRKAELESGSSVLFCFQAPQDCTPSHLTFVYYYLQDFDRPREKGVLDVVIAD